MLLFLTIPLDETNKQLLEDVYLYYRDTMYAVAYSVTQNKADAEDVVQQVFLRLAQKYMPTVQRLSSENTLLYYLLTATRNTALNHYEKANILHEVPFDANLLDSTMLSDTVFNSQLNSVDVPFLSEKISILRPIYREILYQRFVLELSVREIAEIGHLSVSTAKKRLLRAKQLLRKQCEESLNEK